MGKIFSLSLDQFTDIEDLDLKIKTYLSKQKFKGTSSEIILPGDGSCTYIWRSFEKHVADIEALREKRSTKINLIPLYDTRQWNIKPCTDETNQVAREAYQKELDKKQEVIGVFRTIKQSLTELLGEPVEKVIDGTFIWYKPN